MKIEKLYTTSEQDYNDESLSYHGLGPREVSRSFSHRRKDYRGSHLRNSLRPRSHHARLRISGDPSYRYKKRNHIGEDLNYESISAIRHGNSNNIAHDLKVVRTSKFVKRRGMKTKRRVSQRHKKF